MANTCKVKPFLEHWNNIPCATKDLYDYSKHETQTTETTVLTAIIAVVCQSQAQLQATNDMLATDSSQNEIKNSNRVTPSFVIKEQIMLPRNAFC